ncbi:DUF342 domain-containing protein [Geothermobacter hydrogeniphilus]|uniref:Flagellar Assembly Protein A N-terminal region domain-containing protein n=1 Tax=Geothermobacter hydrogeniphilus TaxID=1969733 RepID=A0A1X0XLA4_9BACT|nr:FapA family protein [Geothermobacter hydrogeniphilus]ORJ53675.1 hypothetical protein B5V00_16245 [Geothermobacter hydrogeniphilus]
MPPPGKTHRPAEIGVKVLLDKTTPCYHFSATLQNSQVECRASLKILDSDKPPAPQELITLLNQAGVTESLDLERLAIFCAEAARGTNQSDVLLATGTPPSAGIDGWFEAAVRTTADEAEFNRDEKGNIDFRTRDSFTNVEPDDLIGIIHPPEAGTPGLTAHGQPIEPRMGIPLDIRAGEGARLDPDQGKAFATRAGRVILENNVLTVSEQLIIPGDLDLETGNIDFNGFVEVRGDVLDGFHIKAARGIKVAGNVGACRLESGGPVEIGSASGKGKGEIRCQGPLKTRYLNEVLVECRGDVTVSHEIRNATVKATGRIMVPRGTISGGETVALEGIEARHLGSVSGHRTMVTAGVYFPEEDRLNHLRYRLKSTGSQIQRIDDTLGPLDPGKQKLQALREALQLRVDILTERKQKLLAEKETVKKELDRFKPREHPTANPKINAGAGLREGVILKLGDQVEEIQIERGPVSVIANHTGDGLHYLKLTPLKVSAEKLEAELEEKGIETEKIDRENAQ